MTDPRALRAVVGEADWTDAQEVLVMISGTGFRAGRDLRE